MLVPGYVRAPVGQSVRWLISNGLATMGKRGVKNLEAQWEHRFGSSGVPQLLGSVADNVP